jgi:hypothetical protein
MRAAISEEIMAAFKQNKTDAKKKKFKGKCGFCDIIGHKEANCCKKKAQEVGKLERCRAGGLPPDASGLHKAGTVINSIRMQKYNISANNQQLNLTTKSKSHIFLAMLFIDVLARAMYDTGTGASVVH